MIKPLKALSQHITNLLWINVLPTARVNQGRTVYPNILNQKYSAVQNMKTVVDLQKVSTVPSHIHGKITCTEKSTCAERTVWTTSKLGKFSFLLKFCIGWEDPYLSYQYVSYNDQPNVSFGYAWRNTCKLILWNLVWFVFC